MVNKTELDYAYSYGLPILSRPVFCFPPHSVVLRTRPGDGFLTYFSLFLDFW